MRSADAFLSSEGKIILRLGNFAARFSKSTSFYMKTSTFSITLPVFVLAAAIATDFSRAQTAASPVPASSLASQASPYAIVELGVNYQVWQRETYDPAPDGSIVTNIHKYTELATGLNHSVNGQWVASKEEICNRTI